MDSVFLEILFDFDMKILSEILLGRKSYKKYNNTFEQTVVSKVLLWKAEAGSATEA